MNTLGRLHKVIILISLCLLAQLAISLKAWLPVDREFPLISAFAFLPVHYGVFVDGILLGLLVVCLALLMFKPFNKLLIIGVSVIFFFFVLEDIIRFQPWLYMYVLILLSVAFTKSKENRQQALLIIRIILVGTYFWGGIQKFNHAFTVEIFPWLMHPFGLQNFFAEHHRLAYSVSLVEITGATGLLFRQSQKYAGIMLILMHIILLYALGPLGNAWNKLIWPWNAALTGILALIVNDSSYNGIAEIRSLKSIWAAIVVILTCIMPLFNFFGLWDHDHSCSLYSGNIPRATFYYPVGQEKNMPQSATGATSINHSSENIKIDQWALDELNTPVYPESRYFKRIGAYLCTKVSQPSSTGLLIYEKEKFSSKQSIIDIRCDSLKKIQ